MKIQIDKNNLLTITNENIPQTKEYSYHVSGYSFSDFDKGILVLHKKDWKIINLKNLSDNMNVVYLIDREITIPKISQEAVINALCLFDSFDENTGKKYYFIPKFQEKNLATTNSILEKLNIPANIQKTDK